MKEYMGAGLTTIAKAQAISYALQSIVGSAPVMQYTDKQAIISFTPDQASRLREYITAKTKATGEVADIKINLLPVILPLLIPKAALLIGGILVLGALMGSKAGK